VQPAVNGMPDRTSDVIADLERELVKLRRSGRGAEDPIVVGLGTLIEKIKGRMQPSRRDTIGN
jgi:hypothetical protein